MKERGAKAEAFASKQIRWVYGILKLIKIKT